MTAASICFTAATEEIFEYIIGAGRATALEKVDDC